MNLIHVTYKNNTLEIYESGAYYTLHWPIGGHLTEDMSMTYIVMATYAVLLGVILWDDILDKA